MELKRKPQHVDIEEGTYFITTHTLEFKPVFQEPRLADILRCSIAKVQRLLKLSIYAYVILLNHTHFIIRTSKNNNLSYILFRLKGFSAREVNKARGVQGVSIWQDRFQDHLLRDEQDFENHVNYIHYNPVKHKLVTKPEDWQWSSYRQFVKKGYYEIG